MTESAFDKVVVSLGDDGLGYYCARYENGEPGPRSEGYGRPDNDPQANLAQARAAAQRDFPELDIETEEDQ